MAYPLVIWRLVTEYQTALEVHTVRQLSSHTRGLKAHWPELDVARFKTAGIKTEAGESLIDFKTVININLSYCPVSLIGLTSRLVSLTVRLVITEGAALCRALGACGTLERLDLCLYGLCSPVGVVCRYLQDLPPLQHLTWLRLSCFRLLSSSEVEVHRSLLLSAPALREFEYCGTGYSDAGFSDEMIPLLATQSGLSLVTLPFMSRVDYRPLVPVLRLRLDHHNQEPRQKLIGLSRVKSDTAVLVRECSSLVLLLNRAAVNEVWHVAPSRQVLDALLVETSLQDVYLLLNMAEDFERALRIPSRRLRLRGRGPFLVDLALLTTVSARTECLVLDNFALSYTSRIVWRVSLELLKCSLQFDFQEFAGSQHVKLDTCTLPNGGVINRACL
jgi:hypothetical protein